MRLTTISASWASKPIPYTRTGNFLKLECGHIVQAFGKSQAGGVILCMRCGCAGENLKNEQEPN
jgi:hypothetical protein